jgi:hypothetical protein
MTDDVISVQVEGEKVSAKGQERTIAEINAEAAAWAAEAVQYRSPRRSDSEPPMNHELRALSGRGVLGRFQGRRRSRDRSVLIVHATDWSRSRC